MSQVDIDNSGGVRAKTGPARPAQRTREATARARAERLADTPVWSSSPTSRIAHSELARDAFVTRQAMQQLTAGLQNAGLISRRGDGRATRLQLTAKGTRKLQAASRTAAEVDRKMLAQLDEAQQRHAARQPDQLHRLARRAAR